MNKVEYYQKHQSRFWLERRLEKGTIRTFRRQLRKRNNNNLSFNYKEYQDYEQSFKTKWNILWKTK